MFIYITGLLGQFESEQISERTMTGLQQKASQGLYPFGAVPYGYNLLENGTLKVNKQEKEKLLEAFDLYAYEFKSAKYLDSCGKFDEFRAIDIVRKLENTNLFTFANSQIRGSIPEDKRKNGNVPWEERRNFINNKMKFEKKNMILSEKVVKGLNEITFTNIDETNYDNTLKDINNFIENKLKKGKKFYNLNESNEYNSFIYVSSILTNESISQYRKKIQCFRHFTTETITERESYSLKEKEILIAYGHAICLMISEI